MTENIASHGWSVANGASGSDIGRRIRGAANDYNSRGRGATMSRRVYRGGSWLWVSAPASRGRYLASDRRDVQYGDVYEGEIVAEYTLGQKLPVPSRFWVVVLADEQEKPLKLLSHIKIKSGYRLSMDGCEESLDVPDPSWR